MKWKQWLVVVLILGIVGCSGGGSGDTGKIERFAVDGDSGIPAAVRVSGAGLIHTTQLFPKIEGREGKEDSAVEQLGALLSELETILKEHGSGVEKLAKLNLYVSDPGDGVEVRRVVGKWFGQRPKPAITVVPTALPRLRAKVALDAVAMAPSSDKLDGVEVWSDLAVEKSRTFGGEALAAVCGPESQLIYVSGRAAKAGDLRTGTKGTMEELMSVLQFLGAGPGHVVQIKAFLNPMTEAAFAAEEIQSFFEEGDRPPVVMVEWTSPSLPTEIELIAAIPGEGEEVTEVVYITPPGDKPSPVYSKVAVVKGNDMVYIGEMSGEAKVAADVEVKTLYARMQQAVEAAGSDFRHLVKATYYFSDEEVSKELNTLRPTVYDPKRPPAASKIGVQNIGLPDRGMLIDMVAVPVPGK
jgi:enamine deaminase RidA (YjgF/YER057c/UK114 family)